METPGYQETSSKAQSWKTTAVPPWRPENLHQGAVLAKGEMGGVGHGKGEHVGPVGSEGDEQMQVDEG